MFRVLVMVNIFFPSIFDSFLYSFFICGSGNLILFFFFGPFFYVFRCPASAAGLSKLILNSYFPSGKKEKEGSTKERKQEKK